MNRLISVILIAVMIFGLVGVSFADEKVLAKPIIECCDKYKDIDLNAWYHDGIHFCLFNSFMSGREKDQFMPNEKITRAELISILWKIAGSPDVKNDMPFSDVEPNKWCAKAVLWAYQEKIANGTDGKFMPDKEITREQLAVMIYNFSKSKLTKSTEIKFNDEDKIHDWALDAISFCVGNNLMSGKEGNTFDPLSNATRAETATIIKRLCEQ